MSETETRGADFTANASLAMIAAAHDRLMQQREEARAEVARLRGVVEAVQALADEWEQFYGAGEVLPLDEIVGSLRAVLAPVSSSGEAESGEALPVLACVEPGCFTRYASTGTPQAARHSAAREGWTFYDGDHCPQHSPAPVPSGNVQPMRDPTTPAPIPSGGQADGEGEVERACEVMHDAYEAAAAENGWATQAETRKPWHDVPDANKATMRAAVSALLDYLAARPVLSREALRERLDGHQIKHGWLEVAPYLYQRVCLCGHVLDHEDLGGSLLDHLADVLAGGEQDG